MNDSHSLCSGYPTPVMEWRKFDGTLPPDHIVHDGVLRLNQVQVQDQGQYICRARNRASSQEAIVLLFVTGKLQR